jgi:hypothetical protein
MLPRGDAAVSVLVMPQDGHSSWHCPNVSVMAQ